MTDGNGPCGREKYYQTSLIVGVYNISAVRYACTSRYASTSGVSAVSYVCGRQVNRREEEEAGPGHVHDRS